MSTKIKISPENLERLEKFCQEVGDEVNEQNINIHFEEIVENASQSFFDRNERVYWKAKDDAAFLLLEKMAESEGIQHPNRLLFESSDSLRVYLIAKAFVNDLAIEKMCSVFLPIYDKLPMTEFADKIGDLFKEVSEDKLS